MISALQKFAGMQSFKRCDAGKSCSKSVQVSRNGWSGNECSTPINYDFGPFSFILYSNIPWGTFVWSLSLFCLSERSNSEAFVQINGSNLYEYSQLLSRAKGLSYNLTSRRSSFYSKICDLNIIPLAQGMGIWEPGKPSKITRSVFLNLRLTGYPPSGKQLQTTTIFLPRFSFFW